MPIQVHITIFRIRLMSFGPSRGVWCATLWRLVGPFCASGRNTPASPALLGAPVRRHLVVQWIQWWYLQPKVHRIKYKPLKNRCESASGVPPDPVGRNNRSSSLHRAAHRWRVSNIIWFIFYVYFFFFFSVTRRTALKSEPSKMRPTASVRTWRR